MSEAVQDQTNASAELDASELAQNRWSVISFERCEASKLSYPDALTLIDDLERRGTPGLCIVADEAAMRI